MKKNNLPKIFAFLAIALAIFACSSPINPATPTPQPTYTPVPTNTPIPTYTPVPPTATITPVPLIMGIDRPIMAGSISFLFNSYEITLTLTFNGKKYIADTGKAYYILYCTHTGNSDTLFASGGPFFSPAGSNGGVFYIKGESRQYEWAAVDPAIDNMRIIFVIDSTDPGPFTLVDAVHDWKVDLSTLPTKSK